MGGPKDEKRPNLITITPANESTNVKPSTITLEFDEYVRVETPNKLILVTPRIKKEEMEVTANKNKVTINLKQELEDSTTYVFNFQKSIKDVTEGNVPDNLRLVFSTGNTIDSLEVSGRVSFNFPQDQKSLDGILVGLYTLDDTTNVTTGPPYYVIQTDSAGNFTLENLKQGEYLAYAWQDANSNNKAEFKTEQYAFINDTITVDSTISGLNFILNKADLTPFKIQRSTTFGENFDIITSKTPIEIKIQNEDLGKTLFYTSKEKTLRFYHQNLRNDSTEIRLHLADSVGFKIDTTLYIKFPQSDRKKEQPTPSFSGTKTFLKNLQTQLTFNKPIAHINYDSLLVKYDSASVIPIKPQMVSFKDSLQRSILELTIPIPDSIKATNFTLYLGDSTFQDVESVWTDKKQETTFTKINPETLAEEIKVTVNTTELPLIVQILNSKNEVVQEKYLETTSTTTFKNIEAATYIIRAIVDINKNKRWDTSNLYENRYAEPIYYLINPENPEPYNTIIRSGWTLEVTIEPRKATGIFPKAEEKTK